MWRFHSQMKGGRGDAFAAAVLDDAFTPVSWFLEGEVPDWLDDTLPMFQNAKALYDLVRNSMVDMCKV